MIPLSRQPGQPEASAPGLANDWSSQLAGAITSTETLLHRLQLRTEDVDHAPGFPLRVPEAFLARMRPGDPRDPLLRQVLPVLAERDLTPGFGTDPLAEAAATRAPGLIQKYAHRALLITAPACAVHCRYCFRRNFPYAEHSLGLSFPGLDPIEADADVHEIILSGGDPLMLKDAVLERLVTRLDAMPHLRRLRIHTRLPVVIPARVTDNLLALLARSRLAVAVVLHINHGNEIAGDLPGALAALRRHGLVLLNQSVLLAGVNDSVPALATLSELLFAHGVLPYYLHLPDRVLGTAHFAVAETRARALVKALASELPGYLVPRLAREEAGQPYKTVLSGA
jgi:EF-P beta-lysylation protein EpmB